MSALASSPVPQGESAGPAEGSSASSRRRAFLGDAEARATVTVVEGVFSSEEAARVREAARRAVKRNGGWATDRHRDFATTDLPLYELSPRAFAFVRRTLRKRLLSWCAQRFGLDAADLFFKDLFVVSYNADVAGGQRELALHRDGSLLSFNVLLTPETSFEGGGTSFPALGTVHIRQGDAVVHDGKVLHAGAPVTRGERVILVAFVDTVIDETPSMGDSPEARARRDAQEFRAVHERLRKASAKVDDAVEDAMYLLHSMTVESDADSDDAGDEDPVGDLQSTDADGESGRCAPDAVDKNGSVQATVLQRASLAE
ncbi:Procollagen-lysine,2-oxoglutarate 5-dioxygenase 2 [Hondaea fermentalgiana]|uniref:Procollagen-lysine,2-oxoglutarate 5-dioxygenase 2 n=1 Tax=Hondaea fermentalgiana TaxID=2315210 RepID=A0A2R5GK09_9STRA|nr:Procollagen-lysine,2-oxoglutarate 5-dioxygenase 2 [Hondaea fermentalgiana]|eukprot:GBG30965.1 Procollagen-lysine,2-oxoglutarate 5-dioxygenase 2 [Hondaea fermentalgiana]